MHCTTIGFGYKEGHLFGRALEFGIAFDNTVIYIPNNSKGFIKATSKNYDSKYATIGNHFYDLDPLGDGINEMGLVASANLLPK